MIWAGHVAHMKEIINAYKFLIERRRPEINRHRYTDLRETDRLSTGFIWLRTGSNK
jgi:hypothetical protein